MRPNWRLHPRWARDPQVYAIVIASPRSRLLRGRRRARDGRMGPHPHGGGPPLARRGICAQLVARLLLQAHRLADRRHGDGRRAWASRSMARIAWPASATASPCRRPASACAPMTACLGAGADARRDRHVPGADRASAGRADAYRLGLHPLPPRRGGSPRSGQRSAMRIRSIRCSIPATWSRVPASWTAAPRDCPLLRGGRRRGHPGRAWSGDGRAAAWAEGVLRGVDAMLAAVAGGDLSACADGARVGPARRPRPATSGWRAASWKARISTKACAPAWSTGTERHSWQPARLAEVTDAMLDRYFAPLGRRGASTGPGRAVSGFSAREARATG